MLIYSTISNPTSPRSTCEIKKIYNEKKKASTIMYTNPSQPIPISSTPNPVPTEFSSPISQLSGNADDKRENDLALNGSGLLGLLGSAALGVAVDEEGDEQPGERGEVGGVDDDGPGFAVVAEAGDAAAKVDEEVEDGGGAADDELGDLDGGEELLQEARDLDVESGESVVGVL